MRRSEVSCLWRNSLRMEVDLLDEQTRLVIELDGGQHFANEDAYRRDRRKDALLQEHGYFVLRFLVQDIGAQLDHVLDTILRAMAHLRNGGERRSVHLVMRDKN
jgi:very-short-patch-repair endonuclease